MNDKYLETIYQRAQLWTSSEYDEETRKEVMQMMENDEIKLIDSFYKDLEFGTGGLRGIMGPGTNRMNRYTVGMATQGMANYLVKNFPGKDISVAIAHDCRNNSRQFSEITAGIFSANGLKVYLFESLRPTPELSFAIRQLGCQSGVIITASHNPPEYNGYKAYWEDGGQVTAPHDRNIIEEVRKINTVSEIKFDGPAANIISIGKDIDELFINTIKKISLNRQCIQEKNDIGIVYTPIHGTGVKIIPATLREFGFTNIINVPEQDVIDGNFPTVTSPNPEEPAAFKMALEKAAEHGADIAMATDPDGDRIGVAVKNRSGEFVVLNGNQTGAILTWYIISQMKEKKMLTGKEYIIKTVVTSDLLDRIAEKNNVECYNVLTGFKYFASLMGKLGTGKKYIGGGEESFGYLPGDYVRDKDAVGSCALVAEVAAFMACRGKTLFDTLIDIYYEYGLFREKLVNIVRKGKEGAEEINRIMSNFRKKPPAEINNTEVVKIIDYQIGTMKDLKADTVQSIDFEKSNVLQFLLVDGTKISMRPSGTEPKIKFYFSVNDRLENKSDYEKKEADLDARIEGLVKEMSDRLEL
ncbi:MAG TPA: phospho-sugar mutase [Bacteroidetes bacterium]|nr:phospho-sugar mutase [Bacteroidota bacterium]